MIIKSISHKIVLTIVLPVIVVLMTLGILNYFDTKEIITQLNEAEKKFIRNEIKSFIELQFVALDIIEEPIQLQMKNYSDRLVNEYFTDTTDAAHIDLKKIRDELGMDANTYDLYVISTKGIVVNTTYANDYGINFFSFGEVHKNYLLRIFSEGIFDSPKFFFESNTKKYKKYSYQPTNDRKYIIEIGLYSNQADRIFDYMINHLEQIATQRKNLAKVDLFFWLDKPTSLNSNVEFFPEHLNILDKLKDSVIVNENYKNENNTISNYTYLYVKNQNSKLIKGAIVRLKNDSDNQLYFQKKELLKFVAVLIITLLLIVIIYFLLRPYGIVIKRITDVSKELAIGNLSVNIKSKLTQRKDELGELATSMDTLISGLAQTAEFARQTGKGNFNEKYKLLSEKDVLGKTLVKMQERLTRAKEEEDRSAIEEKKSKFINDGLAKFGEILRTNTNNVNELSKTIIQNLVDFLEIPIGAFFVAESENGETIFNAKATVAYGRTRLFEKQVKMGEGLVGRCAYEKLPIHINDIPSDYLEVSSGLGTTNPKYILLIPLLAENNVHGVLELASFNELEAHKVSFAEKLADSIASTLEGVQTNNRTVELLEQSKIQKEELAEQEEEMRQNMEELQATQEEAMKRESDLTSILQVLDASVFKTEYDAFGVITDINEKYLKYLQLNASDLIGKDHGQESKILGINNPEYSSIWLKIKQGEPQEISIDIKVRQKKRTLKEYYWPINDSNKVIKVSYLC